MVDGDEQPPTAREQDAPTTIPLNQNNNISE